MIEDLIRISNLASTEILDVYDSDFAVSTKSDRSPVTQADVRAHAVIVHELAKIDSTIPVISEEDEIPEFSRRREWRRYWIVDPLDGTREFVERVGEFTVNIALIEDGKPSIGVVNVPTRRCVYSGDVTKQDAFRHTVHGNTRITTRMLQSNTVTLVESRHNKTPSNDRLSDFLNKQGKTVRRESVGSSLKICKIAEGEADLYVRFGPTSEWDLAAAHAVLKAANGNLRLLDGSHMLYNQKESLLNTSFFACGAAPDDWAEQIRTALPELKDAEAKHS